MATTLVLNATYEPLCVVPLNRAVVLVLADRAEVIEADGTLHSPSVKVDLPKVIRLTRYVKVPYRRRRPFSKAGVMTRDGHRCSYCDARATTIDHIVPRARGGTDSWENCTASCEPCNSRKGSKTLEQLGWHLRRPATVPTDRRFLIVGIGRVDPAWEPWLAAAGAPAR